MAFCPRCGAPVAQGARFCAACGETLQAGLYPPQPGAARPDQAGPGSAWPSQARPGSTWPGQAQPGQTWPVGMTREPAMVVVLSIVTLGIYGLYYWWVVSKEVDDHVGRPAHSHGMVRIGTIVTIIAGGALAIAIAGVVSAAIAAGVSGSRPPESAIVGAVLGVIGTVILLALAFMAGRIMILIGKYRMWETIEAEERRRGSGTPLSGGLMLVLTILAWFLPFVGFVLALIVPYVTQEHLNKLWATRP